MSIWASWSAVTRLAVTTSLGAWDIVALRFGVAGLFLAPVLARRGLACDRVGWFGLAVIITGLGAPFALVAASGLRFAPAYDQGALNPGCMPLFVALIASIVLGERRSAAQSLGLLLVLTGVVVIVAWHAAAWNTSHTWGDALFLVAAFMTACGTVVMRQAKLDPLHATALISTGSLVIYLPIYLALHGARLTQAPLADIAIQAAFQGVLVTIVALFLYGRAVVILGASRGAAFGALVPALSALFAIPLLGEWPGRKRTGPASCSFPSGSSWQAEDRFPDHGFACAIAADRTLSVPGCHVQDRCRRTGDGNAVRPDDPLYRRRRSGDTSIRSSGSTGTGTRLCTRRTSSSAVALYAEDVRLESPLVRHLTGSPGGVVQGRDNLRAFIRVVFEHTPTSRGHYRSGFFTDGRKLIWEYPRETPVGDQMDFVESMEIEDGLIRRHCVYWGWFGVKVIEQDRYHR